MYVNTWHRLHLNHILHGPKCEERKFCELYSLAVRSAELIWIGLRYELLRVKCATTSEKIFTSWLFKFFDDLLNSSGNCLDCCQLEPLQAFRMLRRVNHYQSRQSYWYKVIIRSLLHRLRMNYIYSVVVVVVFYLWLHEVATLLTQICLFYMFNITYQPGLGSHYVIKTMPGWSVPLLMVLKSKVEMD